MGDIVINIPRIYTAIAEIMSCWVYLIVCKKKISIVKIILLTGIVGMVEVLYSQISNIVSMWFWPVNMIILFILMFIYMYLILDCTILTVYYYTIKAFIIAEFVASLEWQFAYYYKWVDIPFQPLQLSIAILFYMICVIVLVYVEKRWIMGSVIREISGQESVIATIIVVFIFVLSNIGFFVENTPFSGRTVFDLFSIRTLFDFMGVIVLYAFQSRVAEIEMKMELNILDRCLRTQYDKYRNYQDSIDLINMKYHDLRHQIENLKELNDSEKQSILIDNIESELREYSPYFETGNKVLDALLDSRQAICRKRRIVITAVLNGKLLEFMKVADICTVFGNALDNAIESVSMIEDVEKRLIHIEVKEQKNFVMFLIENTCENCISFENGVPKTIYKDKKNHGYGTRSIVQTVQKYKGSTLFEVDDSSFSLKILIPNTGI